MRGFTLIEVLLVTALLAVVLVIGIPALRTLQANIGVAAESSRLLSLLRFTRAQAAVSRHNTVLCGRAVAEHTPGCAPAGADGWLAFVDRDGDGAFDAGADTLLRELPPPSQPLAVVDRDGDPVSGAIAFRPDGAALRALTMALCAPGATRSRELVISMTGRVRTARVGGPCGA